MASIFDYIFNIKGDYSVKINGLTDSTAEFQASVTKSQKALDGLGQAAIGFESISNVIRNINGVFSGITEAGANAELQLMSLKTLFGGNTEAAEAMYERISEYGKVTPYDKAGLLEAQRTMMSFGMSGEYAFTTLKQIGDIAMGDSQKMQSLALAFAQMSSTGNLTGQDLMQMINAGFNPLNEISKQTGKSVGELKEEMSKGAISAEMVSEAFRSATREGGVALRNTLAILGQGRFLPKQTQEELAAAGIDINKLADTSLSLKDRLDMLKPVLNDAALFSKLFGMENANAARALVQGSDELGRLTTAITGTASAEEQAVNVINVFETEQTENSLNAKYYINSIIDNIYSFKECSPIEKLGSIIKFAQIDLKLIEKNTVERLNGEELPNHLTTLNFIENNRDVFNDDIAPIIKTDKFKKVENVTNIPQQEIKKERNEIEIKRDETEQNYHQITKEDIEEIVYEMFEREVELCLC